MSVFTSRVTKTIEIPHDAGQSVTIRKLSPKQLEKARKMQSVAAMNNLRDLGGPEFMKAVQGLSQEEKTQVEHEAKKQAEAVARDPLKDYDRLELLEQGVTAWSYDVKLTRQAFEDLDEETAVFLAEQILRLARPRAYETEEETEAARKND